MRLRQKVPVCVPLTLAPVSVHLTPAPVVSAGLVLRSFRSSAVGRLFERLSSSVEHGSGVSAETRTKSVSGQSLPRSPKMVGGESSVGKPGCPPPELGNGSRSENTDKKSSSRLGVGGGGLSVEDGCLPLVHKSLLMYRQPTRRPGLFLGPTETLLDPLTFDAVLHTHSVDPSTPAGSVVPDTRSAFFSNNHILGDSMVRCGVGVQVLDCAHCVAHQ